MEQWEFLVKPLFFKRVMKCIKDHRCSLCARTIFVGSSYFSPFDLDQRTGYHLKYCEGCFDERLEGPAPLTTQKGLDK
jgi:hypothetical protein